MRPSIPATGSWPHCGSGGAGTRSGSAMRCGKPSCGFSVNGRRERPGWQLFPTRSRWILTTYTPFMMIRGKRWRWRGWRDGDGRGSCLELECMVCVGSRAPPSTLKFTFFACVPNACVGLLPTTQSNNSMSCLALWMGSSRTRLWPVRIVSVLGVGCQR